MLGMISEQCALIVSDVVLGRPDRIGSEKRLVMLGFDALDIVLVGVSLASAYGAGRLEGRATRRLQELLLYRTGFRDGEVMGWNGHRRWSATQADVKPANERPWRSVRATTSHRRID